MHYSILMPVWALVALAIYKVVSMVVEQRRQAAKAKALGTAPPPAFPNPGLLRTNHLMQAIKADKHKLFPDFLIARQETMNTLTGRVCPTFTSNNLGQHMIFTSDPKNIQAMLATQFEDFCTGPSRRGNMMQTLGDGIFVQDGKAWEHSRGMLRPNFIREQVSDLDLEERHVQNLISVLKINPVDGWTAETEIQTLFFRLTIDSACEFLFGESVDSQIKEAETQAITDEKKSKDERAFSTNFDAAQAIMATRFRLGDLYWLYNPKSYKENNKVVNEFVKHYVDLALSKGTTTMTEKKVEEGRKEKYVLLEALAEQTRDPEELRGQMLNILLAGRDTTASLLSWLFKMLLRHPEVFAKLRRTVLDEFGTFEEPRNITFASLKGCQYLQHCLNETLRLWTVVPGNGRRATRDTTLPRGGGKDGMSPIFVPKDTGVDYSIHVMHRRKDLWGEDADEFKPERFVGRKAGWEFLPFNGGPRICIGQQFALTEASYVVVRLLQKFDGIAPGVEEAKEEVITSNLTLTSCPGRKVTLRLHEARS